jgi:NADH-quinone oxidoreductase subunit J
MFLLAEADTVLINWHTFFFLLFALIACAFAIAVVVASNVVHMAFYLTVCLGATAGLFMLAGAEFLGAMQLMIYVGGTLVLLVFGVMLTAQGRFVSMKTSGSEWVIAAVVGSALLAVLVQAAVSVPSWRSPLGPVSDGDHAKDGLAYQKTVPLDEPNNASELGLGLLGMRPDKNPEQQPDATLREGLSGYLLPFEIISVHLVVVLIGAAYLARTKRRRDATEGEGTAPKS